MSLEFDFSCPRCQVEENLAKVEMTHAGQPAFFMSYRPPEPPEFEVEVPDTCWSCGHEFSDEEKNKVMDEAEAWAAEHQQDFYPDPDE